MTRWATAAAGIALVVALAWWFGLGDVGRALRGASPQGLALYGALTCMVLIAYGARWRLMARAIGHAPPLAHSVAGRLASEAVSALVPSARLAGEPVRIAVAHAHGAALAPATAGVALDRWVDLIGNMCAVLGYVAVIALARSQRAPANALLIGGAMAILLLLMIPPLFQLSRGRRPFAPLHGARARRLAPRFTRWFDALARVEGHIVVFFRAHPRTFLAAVAMALGTELLIVAQYAALFLAFGLALDLSTVAAVLLGGGLSRAVPVPAGLGALEAAQVLTVGSVTGDAELGFVVAVILRLHETLLLGLGLASLPLLGCSLARAFAPTVPQEATS
ncbi:MAG: lysylphosphatidylglycerol synthase transmembrane domain-containing protein [Candidatus Binatia bacterium]